MPSHQSASLESFAFFFFNSHPGPFERPPSPKFDIDAWQQKEILTRTGANELWRDRSLKFGEQD